MFCSSWSVTSLSMLSFNAASFSRVLFVLLRMLLPLPVNRGR